MTFKTKILSVLSVGFGLFIFSNSLKVASMSNKASNSIVSLILSNINPQFDSEIVSIVVRKAAHFSEFLLLGLLTSFCFYSIKKRFSYSIPTILFLCLSIAVTDEFIQTFVLGRSGEVKDVLIDFAGALVGFLIVYFLDKHKRKRFRR